MTVIFNELDCLRVLAPLASPDTRIYVHEAMLKVKAGEKGVSLPKFETGCSKSR